MSLCQAPFPPLLSHDGFGRGIPVESILGEIQPFVQALACPLLSVPTTKGTQRAHRSLHKMTWQGRRLPNWSSRSGFRVVGMASLSVDRPAGALSGGPLDTFPKLLLDHAARRGDTPANREKDYGIWQSWS